MKDMGKCLNLKEREKGMARKMAIQQASKIDGKTISETGGKEVKIQKV
jgi:hypothetical protein